jgi:nicotinamide-nucleotide amidase
MLVLLPGVPGELRALLPQVRDDLRRRRMLPARRPALLLRTAQMAELAVTEACRPLCRQYPELRWSWRLVRWGVDVRIELSWPATDPGPLLDVERQLRARLGLAIYSDRPQQLNEMVQELMLASEATLSVAESCTAGLLGARLTELPGSSAFFRGGVLAYADQIKTDLLAVPERVLATEGAVSRSVVVAMATGCRRLLRTDYALAVTGIAGPDGGSASKPVGTTWICCVSTDAVHARCYRFPGTRGRNRQLAATAALDTLRRLLVAPKSVPWLPLDTWGQPV